MSEHYLDGDQFVPRSQGEVFEFFSRPENLGRITPPDMKFEMRSRDLGMRTGLRLEYRLRPVPGIPAGWVSRITRYSPPDVFIDVQERGPYARWEHTHLFEDAEREGVKGTQIIDHVVYEMPFGPLGELIHALVVRRRLEGIFAFRKKVIDRLLPPIQANQAPMRVAVAGGSGFVGAGIVVELHRRGENVVVLSHRPERARATLPDEVEAHKADVADPQSLGPGLAGCEALVISLAFPNSPMESPRRGYTFDAVDAAGTERLVASAQAAGVRRIVYISGAGAAADAPRHWFRAKARAEAAVTGSGLEYTIIRPTWVYGPDDVALNRFLGFARWLPFVPLTGSGNQQLSPVFIDDVGRLAADAVRSDSARNQVFELGGPETLSMREIIRTALRVSGRRRPLLPAPAILLKLGAWPLQFLPSPPLTPNAVDFVNQPATVDTGPLLARMPRRLTPLAEGLKTYLGRGARG